MGVNDLLKLAPVEDETVYETGIGDLWNRYTPIDATRIGDTTNIGGKRYSNKNKTFNADSIEDLETRYADKSKETPNSEDPYFYKLRNKNTGEVKFGIAPKGVDDRYAGQDLTSWDIEYSEQRSDAVDLESQIHGNVNMLKQRAVDYGFAKNRFGKGATEIYKPIIGSAVDKLKPEQVGLLDKVLKGASDAYEGAKIASGYKAPKDVGRESTDDVVTTLNRMTSTAGETLQDLGRGVILGGQKAVGGLAELVGADSLKEEIQKSATYNVDKMNTKDGIASTIGEILPELALPASVPVKAGVGLAKGIGIGATSGFAINGGYEQLKAISGIEEGQEASPILAGSIGAIIGGFFGGKQGKMIADNFAGLSTKGKDEVLEKLTPEQRQELYEKTGKLEQMTDDEYEAIVGTPRPKEGDVVTSKQEEPTTKEKPETRTGYKTLIEEQVGDSKIVKEFTSLEDKRKTFDAEDGRDAEKTYKELSKIPREKLDDFSVLHDSAYEDIRGMTKEQKIGEESKYNEYRTPELDEAIEASAKGIGDESLQYGAYAKNAEELVRVHKLDPKNTDNINFMISIKAMDGKDGWKILDKYKGDEDLDFVMDVIAKQRKDANDGLFDINKEDITKGYRSTLYKGNRRPATPEELIENPKKKTYYDAEAKREEGVIGSEKQSKKKGSVSSTPKPNVVPDNIDGKELDDWYKNNKDIMTGLDQRELDLINKFEGMSTLTPRQDDYLQGLYNKGYKDVEFKSLKDEQTFMKKNRLRKTKGKYRTVASKEIREELGETSDLAEILTETSRRNQQKSHQQGINRYIKNELDLDNSSLFAKEQKEGMEKLTDKDLETVPYDLREDLKYINKEYKEKLLGRDEQRLYQGNKQYLKIADRLLNNMSTLFKHNVVLKNPASYQNAILVNQTIGLSAGVSPAKLAKYQKQAFTDKMEMEKLIDQLHRQKITGKKRDEVLAKKLSENILYKLERNGLSTNRIDGLVEKNDLLGKMLEDRVYSPIHKVGKQINLGKDTAIGKASLKAFSMIDTSGRYTLARKFMDDGMDIQDAVRKANGLFGDMDKMVPAMIEKLDKYGFIPFAKWYMLTSPQLLKLTKDNPVKAMALGYAVYMLGQETETNLATVNPVEAMVDFAEQALNPIPDKEDDRTVTEKIGKRALSNVVPAGVRNMFESDKFLDVSPTLGADKLRKKRIHYEPFKGVTQSTVDRLKKGED